MTNKLSSRRKAGRSPAQRAKTGADRDKIGKRRQDQDDGSADPGGGRRRVEVLETYFGADGQPIKRTSLGAARVARRYDEHGNKVEEAYFSADGKPTLRKDLGVARIAWRYDERGNKIDAAFYGADGERIAGKAEAQGELEDA